MEQRRRLARFAGFAAVIAILLPLAAEPAAAGSPASPATVSLRVLAIDPNAASTLYAEGVRRLQGVGTIADLFKSDDGGLTWKRASRGLAAGRAPGMSLFADPDHAGVLLAADGEGRLYHSENGGARWLRSAAVPREARSQLFYVPGRRPVLFLNGDGQRLWRSADAGASWERVFESAGLGTVVADPTDSRRLYLNATSSLSGVLVSADGGDSWKPLLPTVAVGRLTVLAVTATRPATIWAGGPAGLYRSRDGGASFATTGLTGRFAEAPLAFDPANPAILYTATADNEGIVQVSTDGGATWVARGEGLAGPVTGLWVDRQTHDVFAQVGQGLVYRAEAGAARWSPGSLRGLPFPPR